MRHSVHMARQVAVEHGETYLSLFTASMGWCQGEDMATIKDVARLAEVSVSTVSNVANNAKFVSEPLRQKVLKAMKRLDYRANNAARSLRGKGSGSIAFMVSDITIPFFAEVLRGMEKSASEHNYNIIICSTDGNIRKEEAYIGMLREKIIDGVIVSSIRGNIEENRHISQLIDDGIPVLVIDRAIKGLHAPSVTIDNKNAAKEAVSYLISLGHRKIGFISGDLLIGINRDRLDGYKEALLEANINYDRFMLREGRDFSVETGYETGLSLLAAANAPTAILTVNDILALGVSYAIHEYDLQIPSDISLIGFDDIPISRFFTPPLTTVAQPMREMGREAFKLLHRCIIGKGWSDEKSIVLPTKLEIRRSTGTPR